jgi:Rha family phage regulatory protein
MNLSTVVNSETMTSRDVAKLTGTRHDNVLSKIKGILNKLDNNFSDLNFKAVKYKDSKGEMRDEIYMTKSGSLFIASRYDVNLHLAVQLRWEELEKNIRPQTTLEWMKLAVEQEEKLQLAIATKAEIGSRREATSMNTASVQTKRANKLEIELDVSKDFCTIKRMQMLNHGIIFNWRLLKSTGIEMDIATKDVFDSNYGTVKSYHRDVWEETYKLTF